MGMKFIQNMKNCVRHIFDWHNHNGVVRKRTYELVFPQNVSPKRSVPHNITRPPYVRNGDIPTLDSIIIKSNEDTTKMTEACRLARKVLNMASKSIEVCHIQYIIIQFVHSNHDTQRWISNSDFTQTIFLYKTHEFGWNIISNNFEVTYLHFFIDLSKFKEKLGSSWMHNPLYVNPHTPIERSSKNSGTEYPCTSRW